MRSLLLSSDEDLDALRRAMDRAFDAYFARMRPIWERERKERSEEHERVRAAWAANPVSVLSHAERTELDQTPRGQSLLQRLGVGENVLSEVADFLQARRELLS
jgi:hypothetical protein